MSRPMQDSRGFTILEALISLSLFLVMLTAVFVSYAPSRLIYAKGERRADIQQNARVGVGEVMRHLRMAGFFPENFTAPAPSPPLADGIRVATDRALAIYGDADDAGASNVFLFCLDGNALRRTRGAVDVADSYVCSTGEVIAEKVVDLRFAYYDENNAPLPSPPVGPYALDGQSTGGLPDMSDTAQRGAVRRVVVTVTAQEEIPGREPQLFTLNSDVWLRNAN